MLVLSRMVNEEIVVGNVRIRVLKIRGNQVRIGIEASRDVAVHREDGRAAIMKDLQEKEKGSEG